MKSVTVYIETNADSNEVGCCHVAVVVFTKKFVDDILARRQLLRDVHDKDPDIQCMEFWDTRVCYFPGTSGEIPACIEEMGDAKRWVEITKKQHDALGFSTMDQERVELERMVIADYGMWWSCCPKHVDRGVETCAFHYEDLVELGKRLENDS